MELRLKTFLPAMVGAAALAGFSVPSWAVPTTCPGVGNIGAGCNEVITVAANGTASAAITNATPYDGTEDNLIGIQNNNAGKLLSITLTGTGIGNLDGDGAFQTGNLCVSNANNPNHCLGDHLYSLSGSQSDPSDYSGSGGNYSNPGGLRPDGTAAVTFAALSAGSVTITFANGGLASGAFAYFSLEEPPTPGGLSIQPPVLAPEPGSLALLGTGLFAAYGFLRRRRRAS